MEGSSTGSLVVPVNILNNSNENKLIRLHVIHDCEGEIISGIERRLKVPLGWIVEHCRYTLTGLIGFKCLVMYMVRHGRDIGLVSCV